MYKLADDVLSSTVWTGWKINVGWTAVRKFLETGRKDGYTLVYTHHCYSTPDYLFVVVASFEKGGEVNRYRLTWDDDGMENLFKAKMKLRSMELIEE